MNEAINYKIFFDQLNKHLLTVECNIARPNSAGQKVSIPAWVPGSYLIRNFAKHVVDIQAFANGQQVPITKIDKNTWECAPVDGPLQLKYHCYCFDNAPRGAYVDAARVFFDGCRIFMVVEGEEEQTCSIEIVRPKFAATKKWRVATSMTPTQIDSEGFGVYTAENHLELIDHPFEISNFKKIDFAVAGVPHEIVIYGASNVDMQRLAKDVASICEGHVRYFGELPTMDKYVFITHAFASGYGGIEHRSSCSLSCSRKDLPLMNDDTTTDEYRGFMGLVSHEYFHAWNVKRIKPEVFTNPDLYNEVYTRQLWIFEGITSYADNLNLVRQGLVSLEEYLKLVQKDINKLQQSPGSYVQTAADSSFDTWIKFYVPDENSINAAVSYYLKGSLIALCLDLMIIQNSQCKQSLADVMQVLWQQYGKTGLGLPEDYFERVTFEVTGDDYSKFFDLAVRTTDPLPFPELLLNIGIVLKNIETPLLERFGWNVSEDKNRLLVRTVINGTVAESAGLAPGDAIVAINNCEVNTSNLENVLQQAGDVPSVTVHYFRDETLQITEMELPAAHYSTAELELVQDTNAQQELQRNKWLS